MDRTPATLLQRLRSSEDREAWPEFVRLYTPLLYHWARRSGQQPHDAADLVQDVFTTLTVEMPRFEYDPHKSFRAWLWALLRNKVRERKRGQASAPAIDSEAATLAQLPDPTPLEEPGQAEYRQQLVRHALRLMQTDFQPVTWRACWEYVVVGRPAAEVAAELGVSIDVVYSAKSRVLRWLRQELKGLLD